MSESVKKSVVNSSNKSKKSKTDILRAALLNYLKQRNYVANEDERLRKTDLTQSPIEMACNTLVQNEVSRSNSFLYSNVFCLNNNSTQVEQQYSRLLSFVQSQIEPIRDELQNILPALLCHLYIEMLKGRDSRPAFEFLKKNAPLVANIDSLSTPLPYKINGTPFNLLNDDTVPVLANGSNSQNSFSRDSEEISEAGNTFKELIQIISTMTRIKDIESHPIVIRFRTSKYELRLSQKSMFALKRYLAKNGHVLIIQALHVWFHIEIFTEDGLTTESSSIFETLLEDCGLETPCGIKKCSGKLKKVVNMGCPNCYDDIQKTLNIKKEDLKTTKRYRTKITLPMPSRFFQNPTKSELLQYSIHQMIPYSFPFKVYNVINSDNKLTSADLDPNGCHIAAGFENSLITLYSVKRNIYYGRKPYETFQDRLCLWNTGNCSRSDDSSSSSDDESSSVQNFPISKRQISKKERWRNFMEKRCTENIFSKAGGVALRGHSKAVTDVLFSKHNPLLLSVSRDQTIRVWKASDYTCASVYRGHNYPIWCIAESPTGLYMATGSKDLTARLWSTDREFPLQTYVGHTQDVDSVAFHPNGSYLASGSTDQTVRLWCVTTGKLLRVFTECRLPVFCVSFSPDGKYLAAAGEETRVRIFDLAAGSQLAELKDVKSPVIGISWTPDSLKIMACSMRGSVKIWDIQNIGKKKTAATTEQQITESTTIPINDSQQVPMPSTSTAIPIQTTSNSNIQLLKSYETRCKRLIKMQYNSNYSMTFIGNN